MEEQQQQHTLMVVEDDPSIRSILGVQLSTAGYRVIPAEDGETALEILETETPDLILLDVMMPTLDGYTVCRRIRANSRTAHIPVIFLTAKSGADERLDGLQEGANDYITKPYSRKELLIRVENLINWSNAQRQSNPLTGLPGNAAIDKVLNEHLASGVGFAFLYADIDNFKAFNDYYSYMAGDAMIKMLAAVMQKVLGREKNTFLGHVGGDDFVAILPVENSRELALEIITEFDALAPDHYSEQDRKSGFIEVENRQLQLTKFPLVSLTVCLIDTDEAEVHHPAQLNDMMAQLKHRGKQQVGSVLVEERRQNPPLQSTGSEG